MFTISNGQRAEVLTQALPYIKRYNGKIVVVKYGGNAMINQELKQQVMEDIVLLETARSLRKEDRAFKLVLSRSEFDMVIYRSESNTCEAYEIKHSREIVEQQYHVLKDEELCADVARKYGAITTKCILYRGINQRVSNQIIYRNVEDWLKCL